MIASQPSNDARRLVITMITKAAIRAEMQEHEHKKREVARLITALQTMPAGIVRQLDMTQLIKGLNLDLSYSTVLNVVQDYRKGLEGKEAMAGDKNQAEQVGAQVVLDRIAAIATKTYAHLGDNEQVATEDAMAMIHRELKAFDPSLLVRNAKRRLPKQPPRV